MAFEGLRDQIRDTLIDIRDKIEASPTYNNLKEQFDGLPVATQRLVITGVAFLIAGLILYFPYSYISTSQDSIAFFNDKRTLIRNLLRASRLSAVTASIPRGLPASELRSRVEGEIATMGLVAEQLAGAQELPPGDISPALAPAPVKQEIVSLNLKKLNLNQVVEIGTRLQNINPLVKLISLEVQAGSPDPHYFDVMFKLISFTVPEPVENEEPADRGAGFRGKRKGDTGGGEATEPPPDETEE